MLLFKHYFERKSYKELLKKSNLNKIKPCESGVSQGSIICSGY